MTYQLLPLIDHYSKTVKQIVKYYTTDKILYACLEIKSQSNAVKKNNKIRVRDNFSSNSQGVVFVYAFSVFVQSSIVMQLPFCTV